MAITLANARELAAKSHEARRQKTLARQQLPELHAMPEKQEQIAEDDFREVAKLRVREQFKKLQDKIDDVLDRRELDVKAMRDLADASLKLESIEQKLSGRAGPGTLKPSNKPQSRRQLSDPEPSPEPILDKPTIPPAVPEGLDPGI